MTSPFGNAHLFYASEELVTPEPFEINPTFGRWTSTQTDGAVNVQGQSINLRWGIVPDGSDIDEASSGIAGESTDNSELISFFDGLYGDGGGGADLTGRPWFSIFDDSMDRLGELFGVTYTYTAIASATAVPNFGGAADVLIAGHSLGAGVGAGVLAYNYFPNAGDMVINTDFAAFYGNAANNSIRTRNVLMHEQGHGLGLDHVESTNPTNFGFLMEPSINTSFDGPQLDDLLGFQRNYGDVNEKGSGNDTFGNATDLGTIAANASVSRGTNGTSTVIAAADTDFLSIDDETDTDFFQFTVTQSSTVDLTLTPRGVSYNVGPQGGATPEPTFDAQSQSNLQLELLDTDGSTVLISANNTAAGSAETISSGTLNAGTYFARVTGLTNDVIQLYQLDVAVASTNNIVTADDNSGATGNGAANGVADTFLVRKNGAGTMIEVLINGSLAHTFDTTTPIQINGSSDDDTFTLDYSNGDSIPTGLISFVGSTGTNTLNVTGAGNVTNVNYAPDAAINGDGVLTIDGKAATFTGLTPLNVTGVTNFTLTTPNGDDVLTIDAPSGTENRVSGTSGGVGFEAVTFSTVANFTIDADANDDGSPADTITFTSDLLATSLSTFTVESAAGSTTSFTGGISSASSIDVTSGTINVNNTVTATGASTISLDAIGNAGVVNVNQAISTTSGSISITADDDVLFAPTGDLTSTSGAVIVRADDDATSDAGAGGALTMADGTVINAGSGTVTLSADETISIGRLVSTDATTAISITTVSGAINDAGDTGGSDLVATSGRAILTANDATNGGIGANVNGSLETELQSLSAAAGGSSGINISQTGNVVATAVANSGTITITGTGTLSTDGAWSANSIDVDVAGTLTVANNLTTDQASGVDLNTTSGSVVLNAGVVVDTSTQNGSLNLTSDDIDVSATSTLTAGSGTIAFLPNAARTVDVGATGGAGQYVVTDAELDRATTTGIVQVGNASSGNVVFTGAVALDGTNTDTLSVISGGTINDTGATVVFNDTNLALSTLAGGGIGTSSTLNVQVTNLAANDGSAGGVDITNTGDVIVGTVAGITGVSTTTGATRLASTGSITANEQIAADGTVTVDAANDYNGNSLVNSLNGGITIGAEDDVILSATGDVTVTSGAGAITIIADDDAVGDAGAGGLLTMADGAVVTADTGTITLSADENVTVGRVVTLGNSANAIAITSASGAILDGGDTGSSDVSAVNGTATLTADDSIGVFADGLETEVAALVATAGSSDGITVSNNGNVVATLTANLGQAKLNVTGTLDTGGASSANSFDLDATSNITVAHNITTDTSGGVNITSTMGSVLVNNGNEINTSSNGGFVQLTSNDIDLQGTINSGVASVRLEANAGRDIDLGAAGSGDYILTDPELDNITTAGDIQVFALGGNAVFEGAIAMAGSDILKLTTTGTITDTGATVVFTDTSLALDAGQGVGASGTPLNTAVSNLAATAATGGVFVSNTGNVDITDVAAITGITATNSNIFVESAGSITVSSPISATGVGTVDMQAIGGDAGDVILDNSVTTAGGALTVNAHDNITANTNGDLTSNNGAIVVLADADSSEVGDITMTDGAIWDSGSGTLSVTAAGAIAIGQLISTNNTATAIIVFAEHNAISDAGNTGGVDVSAVNGTASIVAADGTNGNIGAGNAIETSVNTLIVRGAGNSGANIDNTGNLIASVQAGTAQATAINVAGTFSSGANSIAASFDIDATGDITFDHTWQSQATPGINVASSGGSIVVNAAMSDLSNGPITLDSQNGDNGNITVNASITSGMGAINLLADNDVISNASGVLTTTSGLLTVTADDDSNANGRIQLAGDVDHGSTGSSWSTAEVENPSNSTFAGFVSGIISGAGTLAHNGVGELRLSGVNTYTGVTTINTGTIEVRNNSALGASGASQGTVVTATGELQYGSAFLTIAEPLTSNAGTISTLAGIGVPNQAGIVTFAGAGQTTLDPGPSGTGLQLSNQLTGAQGFTVDGSVFITGDNNNDFAGNVTILVGSITTEFAEALGAIAGSTTVQAGAFLTLSGAAGGQNFPEPITLSGTIRNDNGDNTLSGQLTLSGTGTLHVDNNETLTITGIINETGGASNLVHTPEAGTLNLEAANTYTGTTTVNNGRLNVNGSIGNGAVTIAAAATLGGTGTIGGAVTNNGEISPGNSAGDLTVNDDVNFANDSTFTVEIGGLTAGTQYDQLSSTGEVSIGSDVVLTTSQLDGFVPIVGNQFTIIDRVGGTGMFQGLGENATITNFMGIGLNATISYLGGSGDDVVLTVSPTPTTTVTLDGNDLLIQDTNSDDTDDDITVSTNGTIVTFTDPNNTITTAIAGSTGSGTNTVTVPLTAFTGGIVVDTLGGDDSLTVSFADGNFTRTVTYNGGAQNTDPNGDTLTLSGGGTFDSATHTLIDDSSGTVDITGNSQISYNGLEPIIDNLSVTDRVFTFTGGAETITVSEDGGANNNLQTIDSTLGEVITFLRPVSSATINAGSGIDTINIQGLDANWDANLTINGDATADTITFQTNATNTGGGSIAATAETININAAITAAAGTISLTTDSLAIAAAVSGTNTLTIAPQTSSASIGIGGGAGTLNIDDAELALLTNGFSGVTIGDSSSGSGPVTVADSSFSDPITITSPAAGGTIAVSGLLTGTDNASITLNSQTTTVGANIVTAGGAVSVGASTVVATDLSIDTTNGGAVPAGGNVAFSGIVNADNAINRDITIDAGTAGTVLFAGAVGGTLTPRNLNVTGQTITIAGGAISTSGDQDYNNGVIVSADAVLAANDVTFDSTIDSDAGQSRSLTVNTGGAGVTTFTGVVGGTTPLASLSTNADGRTDLAANVTTDGNSVTFADPLLLTANVLITAAADVTFAAVESATGNNFTLTVNTGNGATIFGAAVGGDALAALSDDAGLGAVTTDSNGSTQINGGAITTTGDQTFGNTTTVAANAVLTAREINFNGGAGSVSGAVSLTLAPASVASNITVGSAADTGAAVLDITDTDLAALADGFTSITIGDTANGTGNVDIDTANFVDPVTLAGATITDNTGTDVTISNDTVTFDGNLTPGQSPGITIVSGNATFANGSVFSVEIGGASPGEGAGFHDQLDATGSVTIGTSVALSESLFAPFTPLDGQSFEIVNRTGGSGTFDSRPEGFVFTNFLGASLNATLSYVGGDGDDIVITIDGTAPVANSFERQTPADSPTNANVLVFRATFSEAVVGVDTTDFVVNGTTTATVTNVATIDSSTYDVTVSGGDLAGFNGNVGLNFAAVPVITDLANNSLTVAEPATDEEYLVDNTAPVLNSFTLSTPATSPTNADSLIFLATFSEDVANVDVADFAVNSASTATITNVAQQSASTYLITVSGGNLDSFNGTVGLDVSGTPTIDDVAGNALPTGEPATDLVYTVDNVAPALNSFTLSTPATSPTNADTLTFLATFSEDVVNVDSTDFAVDSASTAAITNVVQQTASTYLVTVSGGNLASFDGTVGLDVVAVPTVSDLAGNALPTGEPGTDEEYTVDNTAPVLDSFTLSNPATSPTNADSLTFLATFNEDVTNVDVADFTVNSTSTATISNVVQQTASTYLITVSGGDLDSFNGTVGLDVSGTPSVADLSLNALATGEPGTDEEYTVDNVAPVLNSFTLSNPATSPTNADSLTFLATFNEDVANVDATDFAVDSTSTATITNVVQQTASTYLVAVSGGDLSGFNGTVGLNVVAVPTIVDLAGNSLATGEPGIDQEYTVDNAAPVLTSFTRSNPASVTTNVDSLVFLATFDEDVVNVDAGDFVVSGGSSATVTNISQQTTSTYLITVSGGNLASFNGTVGLNVSGTPTINDQAGNSLATGEPATDEAYTVDNTAPELNSFTRSNPATSPTNADTLVFLATFNEDVLNVDASDFTVNSTSSAAITNVVQQTASTYLITVSGGDLASFDGTVGLDVVAIPTIDDVATNAFATGEPGTDEEYTVDNTAPVLNSFTLSNPATSPTNADALIFLATFNEDVANVDVADFSVDSTSSATVSSVTQQTASTYLITVSGGDLAGFNGTVGLNVVAVPTIDDVAGNALLTGEPATDLEYTVDNIAPTLNSFVRLTPATSLTTSDTLVFRATFDEPVANVDSADFVVDGTTTAGVTNVAMVSATQFDITVSGGDLANFNGTVGLNLAGAQDIADVAGNVLPAGEPATDEEYLVDNATPVLNSIARFNPLTSPTQADSLVFRLSFNEDVTGLVAADFTVTGSTAVISNVSTVNASTYDLTVSGGNLAGLNAVVGLDVAASPATTDLAGNSLPQIEPVTDETYVVDNDPPETTSFTRQNPTNATTNVDVLVFRATFDEDVSGVDVGDFVVDSTSTAGVTDVATISDSVYDITVSGGDLANFNGTVGLNFGGSVTIQDLAGLALPNTEPATDEIYTLDNLGPALDEIARFNPPTSPTNADSLNFRLTFNTDVVNVDVTDFTVDGTTTSSVTNVNPVSASVYIVEVSGGNLADFNGVVGLNISVASDIEDLTSNALIVGEPAVDETYLVDNDAPDVTSFTLSNPVSSPTNADSLVFLATFNEDVTGVDTADFAVNGATTATVTNVTMLTASTYNVTVSGGNLSSFNGVVGLDLAIAQDVTDLAGNPLPAGEPGIDETYTVDNDAPSLNSFTLFNPANSPTNADTLTFRATFDENVANVGIADFDVNGGVGITVSVVTQISASVYEVTISGGDLANLEGVVGLDLAAGQDVTDIAGNALPAGEPGLDELYTVDNTAPVLNSFTRQTPPDQLTNADSLVFRATFGEAVSNVTTGDFAVNSTSTAGVTAVAMISATEFDVTVSGGDLAGFTGTVGLDLGGAQDITDLAGNVLGAGEPLTDEGYALDNTAPTLTSFTIFNPASSPTNSDTLVFRATFDEDVTNVDVTDFDVNGTTTAGVTAVNMISATVFEVTVSGGDLAGFNGTVGVDLAGAQDITDTAGNSLPVGEPATDETYLLDNVAPTLDIVDVAEPAYAAVGVVVFNFSEDVDADFDLADITLTRDAINVPLGALTLTMVSASQYTLDLTTVTNQDGDYVLTVTAAGSNIDDLAGNALAVDASDAFTIDINDDPTIDSANTFNVAENTTAVGTVTATDPDLPAQTLTFTITGGADQLLFGLDSLSGELSFNAPQNFEVPGDTNSDNVFDVTVQVSDGFGGVDTQSISVSVTNAAETFVVGSADWPADGLVRLAISGGLLHAFDSANMDIVPPHIPASVTDIDLDSRAAGNDTLSIDTSGGDPIVPGGANFNGIGGTNTLIAPNAANNWVLNGDDAGTLTSTYTTIFSNVANVTGGTLADSFDLQAGSLSGAITDAAGVGAVTKTTAGTFNLLGASTYTTATSVTAGTLNVGGSITSNTTVDSGATLGGSGSITGTATANGGATIDPGSTNGGLNISGLATFNDTPASNLDVTISGNVPGTDSDLLVANGVMISPGAELNAAVANVPTLGIPHVIVSNTSGVPVSGTFAGKGEGAMFAVGALTGSISYLGGDGNDITITLIGELDLGDAPDTGVGTGVGNYRTTFADIGPFHVITGPQLGVLRDNEADGQPNATATGDDLAGVDDEDGLVSQSTLVPGGLGEIVVNVQGGAAFLDAFMDFNNNGDFEASERITAAAGTAVAVGDNTITFSLPAATPAGTLFTRLRLSTAGGLDQGGLAVDGEVEDHALTVSAQPTEVVVDDDFGANPGDPNQGGEFGVDRFSSLQQAIDATAPGGTLTVNPGSYPEILTIDKDITIQGASQNASDVVINPGAGNDALTITAGNVQWTNATFTGGCNGIVVNGAAVSLTLADITSTLNSCDGINVAAANSVTLDDSRFTGNGDDGIDLNNVTGQTMIVETVATGNLSEGIDLNGTSDVLLDGGTFNGIMARTVNSFTFNSTTTGNLSVLGVIDIESENAIEIDADIDASSNTIRLLANQDAAGAEGITMASDASLVTLNESVDAVLLAVNTLIGGTGSVEISEISAGATSGRISIIAMNGSVTDANNGNNLTANSALLTSSGSIGTAGDRIETVLSNVEGSGTGGFFLTNNGNLVIGGVDAGTTGVTSISGTVDVQTNSPLTVAEDVSANVVFLKANDSTGFGDDLTISAGTTVQATAGDVDLQAGDDVTLQATSTIIATGAINIEIDCDNADLGAGSTATIAGQLTAPSGININGQGDDDNFVITYPTGATFGGAISITDTGNSSSVDMVTINGTVADESLFVTPGATNVVGRGGVATETISFASNIESLRLNAGDGDDTVASSPSTSLSQTLDGGAPGVGAVPGDTLDFDAGGTFSISGNVISTSNNEDVAFQNFENLPLTNPSPTGPLRFDFGRTNSAVQAGYTQVLNNTLFSDGLGYGWDRVGASHFSSNTYVGNIRRDIIIDNTTFGSTPATFSANVADGDVLVNVTFGSQFNALDDFRIFNADTGEQLAGGLTTKAFHSSHVSFVTTVTGSQLNLRFVPPNTKPRLASINAIEIHPSSSLLAMGLTGISSSPIDGDGATIDDYPIAGAPANTLITVSTTLGTIINSDVEPDLDGIQILTDGSGAATLQLMRPTGSGTALVDLLAVDGSATGAAAIEFGIQQTQRFDFNSNNSPTFDPATPANPTGFIGVKTSDMYSEGLGFGWLNYQPGNFDDAQLTPVGAQTDLRRDGHRATGPNTFRVDLNDGSYKVDVLMGNRVDHRDMSVTANGVVVLPDIDISARDYTQLSFTTTVTNGQLDLLFAEDGPSAPNRNWLINALVIQPTSEVSEFNVSTAPGAVNADGLTSTTFNATTTLADGSLVTIQTSKGMVTSTDVDNSYIGTQVAVAGGAISFDILSPSKSGTPTINLKSLDATHETTIFDPTVLDFVVPVSQRLDFNVNSSASPTAADFLGVPRQQIDASVNGIGWTESVNSFDISGALNGVTTTALYQDGHRGGTPKTGTFQIEAKPGVSYDVRTYIGNGRFDLDDVEITVEGAGVLVAPPTGPRQFTSVTFLNAFDLDSDGLISVSIRDNGGLRTGWSINGIDIAESATGLPVTAPLFASSSSMSVEVPPELTQEEISSVLSVATASWMLTDLTDVQRERLQTISVTVDDLDDGLLGLAGSREIVIDDDASGNGWSTDLNSVTPGRVDLLTVIAHELGHILGRGDLDPGLTIGDQLMLPSLENGVRHDQVESIDNFFEAALNSVIPFETN